MNSEKFNLLQEKIGYHFDKLDLLLRALTHRSFSNSNNERLEFLGDAVLNYVISNFLYRKYDCISEGDMSRIRANLVCSKTLAILAIELDIGQFVQLGPGELKNKGYKRESILSDVLEAIIGGIFLDSNIKIVENIVFSWFKTYFDTTGFINTLKDPKTRLQEYLQHHHLSLPRYYVDQVIGQDHNQSFLVSCQINNLINPVVGFGSSKRKAEQEAAKSALKMLIKNDNNKID